MERWKAMGTAAALWLAAGVGFAQGGPVTYVLDADSSFTEGCWPPCKCPLFLAESLTGTFELEFTGSTPDWYDHYAVTNVSWVITQGGEQRLVTGSGTYDIGGHVLPTERLQLDLVIDGIGPEHFDSGGLLFGGQDFPRIDLAINRNGLVCFDQLFDLNARPETIGTTYCAVARNSSGLPATIAVTGSLDVGDQDLTLLAHGAPAGTPGLFYFGSMQTELPFGEGFRCVDGALFRLNPPQMTSGGGNAVRQVDFSSPPVAGNLLPGTSWNFQFWFRDPAGGPAGFNLSDAVRVDFL